MFKLLTGRVVHVAETVNEQLLAAMTQPAPPIGTLAPTVPIPVVEVVDKALAFDKEDRWADARSMQRTIREAYKTIAEDAPASVRLSFDDNGSVAHADTIAAASKVPTSLTAANDSAVFGTRRPRRRSKLGFIVTLGALGAGGYYLLNRGSVELPTSLQIGEDGGVLGTAAFNIPSALARIKQALPNNPPTAESALPGRTETPRIGDPASNPPPADPNGPAVAASAGVEHAPEPADSAGLLADGIESPGTGAAPVAAASASPAPAPGPRAAPPAPPKPSAVHKPAPTKKKPIHHRRRP